MPYPGSNLFSLASGGAIYARDPFCQIDEEQLNGGEVVALEENDWRLILPYLKENERLFGISIEHDLLRVKGTHMSPLQVYRKVRPKQTTLEQSGLEEWTEKGQP
jgi:nitrogen fixation protein